MTVTFEIGWWMSPFALWLFIATWYAVDERDFTGGCCMLFTAWMFLSAARWL